MCEDPFKYYSSTVWFTELWRVLNQKDQRARARRPLGVDSVGGGAGVQVGIFSLIMTTLDERTEYLCDQNYPNAEREVWLN